jgi:hypothetical protein
LIGHSKELKKCFQNKESEKVRCENCERCWIMDVKLWILDDGFCSDAMSELIARLKPCPTNKSPLSLFNKGGKKGISLFTSHLSLFYFSLFNYESL